MVLLAAFAILVFNLFKRDIYLKIYGLPFSKSEYSELIAEDRQTDLGFRQEWKDSLDNGELRTVIDKVSKTPEKRLLAKKMLEGSLRDLEKVLRNMNSKAVALESSNNFSKLLRCSALLGDDERLLAKAILKIEKDPPIYVASMISGSNLKFMVLEPDETATLEDCYVSYK